MAKLVNIEGVQFFILNASEVTLSTKYLFKGNLSFIFNNTLQYQAIMTLFIRIIQPVNQITLNASNKLVFGKTCTLSQNKKIYSFDILRENEGYFVIGCDVNQSERNKLVSCLFLLIFLQRHYFLSNPTLFQREQKEHLLHFLLARESIWI